MNFPTGGAGVKVTRMRTAVNARGKKLIAIVSVVVLLLAARFVSHSIYEAPPDVSPPAGTSSANNRAPGVARSTPDSTGPAVASTTTANSTAPLTSDPTHEKAIEEETQTIEGNDMSVDLPADPRRDPRRAKVEAQCWGLRGSAIQDFTVTLDREVRTSGKASALISGQAESAGYATMFQTSSATPMRGKRVEFSVDLRTEGATRGANLLLRAEDEYGRTVAFDNMQSYGPDGRPDQVINHGVKGNTEWSTQQVVVDIPDSARVITYGVSMFGGGKVWLDNARIEVVTNDIATTALDSPYPLQPNVMPLNPASLNRSPRNLDFDLQAKALAPPCN